MAESPIPRLPPGVRRLFRFPFRTFAHVRRDLDDEVRFHLEMRAEELVSGGMSPEDAWAEALRRFGDADDLKAFCRSLERPAVVRSRVREWLTDLGQDLRFAGRQLRRSPGFTLVALLTLALGIGANTTIYSAVHALLLTSLPYPGGDRIVSLQRTLHQGRVSVPPTPAIVDAWRARSRGLEAVAVFRNAEWTFSDGGDPELVRGDEIGPEAATFLGAHALVGRLFTSDDARPGAAPVMLLSEGLWHRRFGGRHDILGRSVTLDGRQHTVVGVMPGDFGRWILGDLDLRQAFVPLAGAPEVHWVSAVGRLRPGVTMAEATRELSTIAATADEASPGDAPGAQARPIRDVEVQEYGTTLKLLFGAVGLVLLIACANVANLLLVRAWSRQREFGIRTAMGAGRGRLVRQLLTESVVLSLIGGAVGALLAWRAIPLVTALRPPMMGFLDEVRIDPAVFAWILGLALLTGVGFGLAPGLFATERRVGDTLKDTARTMAGHAGSRRLRGILVVTEIALSTVLLIGAGLLVRSLIARTQADATLYPSGLMAVDLELPAERYPSPTSRAGALDQIVDRVRGGPGVEAAALAMTSPWGRAILVAPLDIEGRAVGSEQKPVVLGYNQVQRDYFRAVGVPLLAGRIFAADTTRHEVVVSQAFSRRFFPAGGALGARLRFRGAGGWRTVVGVVRDAQFPGESGGPGAESIYDPPSGARALATVVVRGENPAAVLPFITRSILAMDPTIRVRNAQTMDRALADARAQPRFVMTLLTAFAALALGLAAVGLYGVVAFSVSQRTHEIGVRVALGARSEDVLRLVLRQGFALALLGIAIGLAGAAAATRLIRSELYGVGAGDPVTFVAVAGVLAAVALAASYLPARAALRVDPVEALRAVG